MIKNRVIALALAAFVGVALTATPVLAAKAHFIGTPTKTVSGNTLTVSFKVAGLGNAPTASFTLEGSVTVASRCYTKSGNKPQAANKRETTLVSSTGTFPVRNGQTTGTMSITAPASTLECPPGQKVVIESVSFSNVTLKGQGLTYTF